MWDIVGHERAVELLSRTVVAGTPAHAYLFLGAPGIGKTTLARQLAAALNCTGPNPPCGSCASCRKIGANAHPDVQVVAAGDEANPNARLIKIDRLRDVIHDASLLPVEGGYRVIILDADAVQTVQASALLKSLEEPAGSTIFALTALAEDSLPDAIVSRCQLVHLRPVPVRELARVLQERQGLPPERALELARMAGGRPGRALALARDPSILERESAEIDEVLRASRGKAFDWLVLASSVAATPDRARASLGVWLGWWRDALMLSLGREGALAHHDRLADLRRFAEGKLPGRLETQLRAIERTARLIDANVNARLAMENLALELSE